LKEFKAQAEAAQGVPGGAQRWDTGQCHGSGALPSRLAPRQEKAAIAPRWTCWQAAFLPGHWKGGWGYANCPGP